MTETTEATTGFGFDGDDTETPVGDYINITSGDKPIDTGRYVKSLTWEDNEGNPYFEVVVETADGRTVNRRYYEPKVDGMYVKDEADLGKKQKTISKVLANISRRFLGNDYKVPFSPSYKETVQKVISDIGDKYKGVELRVKLVLNTNDYTTLPGYAPFMENVTVSDEDSKLTITNIDKVEPETSETEADAPTETKEW